MARKQYRARISENKNIYTIFVILLSAFMIIIPFLRGLFFRIDYMPAIIGISVLFVAYMAYNFRVKVFQGIDTYIGISVLLISAVYLISFFFAVNAKDAQDMFFIYFSYFMVYKLTSDLSAKDERYKNIFINLLIASTFILSFTSMLHMAGILNFSGVFIGKKLFGLYQYANTTASVLGVGIILSLNKQIIEENIKAAAIYQMILTALISSFIFTLSRGGYLVLAAVLLLNFLLIKARLKLKLILSIFVSFISNSFLIYKYYNLPEDQLSIIWIYYLISVIASAIIIYIAFSLSNRFKQLFADKNINRILLLVIIVFLGAAIFLLTAKGPEGYKYIPKDIIDRLSDINLSTESVSLRIYFAKDGLKIIKDYPIVGAGGGAWRNLYRQYQSIPYNTTEVHNFYVQYGTEVGIIGLIILAGLIMLLIMSMVKAIKSGSQYLYVYIAAILLFLHSMIDFNLSLVAVGYILWMLIGVINSDKNSLVIKKLPQKQLSGLLLLAALIVLSITSLTYYGIRSGNQGTIAYNKENNESKAIELYEKAIRFDKYNGAYRMELAQVMSMQLRKTKDKKYYDGILEQISLIQKYEPYNHNYSPVICNMYLGMGKFEEASALADEQLNAEKKVALTYMVKIDVDYEIARYYLASDKIKEATPYLGKIVDTKSRFDEMNKSLKDPLKLSEDHQKKIEAVQNILEMIEKTQQ